MSEIKAILAEHTEIFKEHSFAVIKLKNIDYQIKVATEIDKDNINPSLLAEQKILSAMVLELAEKISVLERSYESKSEEFKSESRNLKIFSGVILITSIAGFWMNAEYGFPWFFGCLIVSYYTFKMSLNKMLMSFGKTQKEIDSDAKKSDMENYAKRQDQENLAKAIAKEMKK